jgi:hypothetical protein
MLTVTNMKALGLKDNQMAKEHLLMKMETFMKV